MAKKLLNSQTARCDCCLHGTMNEDTGTVFCTKRGVTSPTDHCRSFSYDPTVRVPKAPKTPEPHQKEEFEL